MVVRIEDSGGKDREQQWRGLRAMMRVENVARVRVENVVRVGDSGDRGWGRRQGSRTAVARVKDSSGEVEGCGRSRCS